MRKRQFSIWLFVLFTLGGFTPARSQEQSDAEVFKDLSLSKGPAQYTREVDRRRGVISLSAKQAQYVPGDHYANWLWDETKFRAGSYYVQLNYHSKRTKLGVQARIGQLDTVKGYAPRTANNLPASTNLGKASVESTANYPVVLLTGDQSNVDDFMVKGMDFVPAPEGEMPTQGIDGSLQLPAGSATLYATKMHYQPEGKKLTQWQEAKDWAEWEFEVSNPDKFEVIIVQRGEGSDIDVLINDQQFNFKSEAAQADDDWKEVAIGVVELNLAGRHKLAVIPKQKVGDSTMELQQILFNPTK